LFPIIAAGFAVVPAIIFSIKRRATRIAIVDQSGKSLLGEENLSVERMTAKAARERFDENLDAPPDERLTKRGAVCRVVRLHRL